MIRRVRGLEFDGSCINITLGLTQIPHISFSYSDNVSSEWVREMGSQIPVADTPGIYETEDGSLKMRSSVARELLFPRLPQFGAANAIMQAVSNFVHPDIGFDSDLLEDFRIMGSKSSLENSAKGIEAEFAVRYRLIKWTNQRICFGSQTGGSAVGVLRL